MLWTAPWGGQLHETHFVNQETRTQRWSHLPKASCWCLGDPESSSQQPGPLIWHSVSLGARCVPSLPPLTFQECNFMRWGFHQCGKLLLWSTKSACLWLAHFCLLMGQVLLRVTFQKSQSPCMPSCMGAASWGPSVLLELTSSPVTSMQMIPNWVIESILNSLRITGMQIKKMPLAHLKL